MQPLEEELDTCRKLRELGFYAKAAAQLRTHLDATNNLHVAADLGDTLMFQGYWQQSLKVLEYGIHNCAREADGELLRIQVQLQICLLKPIVTGFFNESIECAAKLYTDFLALNSSTQLERTAVAIESYYSMILQITANFHVYQPSKSMDDAVLRLEKIFNDLVMHGRFGEAYTIASEFNKCVIIHNSSKGSLCDLPDGTALLKILSERPDVPVIVRAKSVDKLAVAATSSGDTATSHNLEALAMNLFNQSGHAHGTLDILLRKACRNIQEGAVDLDQEMESIKGHLQTYENQQFLHGLHISVSSVMTSADRLFNFELQLELAHRSEDLATEGGAKLLWVLHYAGILARWLTHSGRAPTVIEGAKLLYEDIQGCDCQWVKGLVAKITAQAYLEIGDRQHSLEWSALCKDSWSFCSPMDRADSFTLELRSKLGLHLDGDVIEMIIDSAVIQIEEEIENGLVIPVINQMDHILSQVFIPKNDKRLLPWIRRMEELISELDGMDADIKRANLYQSHASALLIESKNTDDIKIEKEAILLLEMAVPLYMKHKNLVEAAITRQMHGMVLISIFQKSPTPHALQAAIDIFSIVNEAFYNLQNSVQLSSSSYWYAYLAYKGWCRGWIDGQCVLNALLFAESARDEERIDLSILESMEALAGKRNLGASKHVRGVYNMALQICLQENNPQLLWEWLQKGKARSLSDILGLGSQTSKALSSAIDSNDATRDLFKMEKALLIAIKMGDAKERLSRRRDLYNLQKQMRDYAPLKAMMDLRDGHPVSLTGLHSLLEETLSNNAILGSICTNLMFVDWFFTNGDVYLCTVKRKELPLVRKCHISQQSIERWKKNHLDSEGGRNESIMNDDLEEDDPSYPLRHLDPLLEPLKDLLDKDAILILSVSDILHSVPMHALWIDGQPLITRNPMVYCASMTIFTQCWRQAAARKIEKSKMTMMAVFEPTPGTGFSKKEQQKVYNEIYNLVSTPDAVITGAAGSRFALEEAMKSSTHIHFHGHCRLDKDLITDQSLVLSDGDFTVRDVFKQKLLGLHITLIACDSASQSISAGDEPLGMVTALLCAGASSVLGTIWPTTSSTGRNFSAEFYAELMKYPGGHILNLATALQKAVVSIRKERTTRHPCHWASFVLHGACFTI